MTAARRFRAWCIRLYGLFRPSHTHGRITDEIESHLQLHIDDNLRQGMSSRKARREAILMLGGIESTRQQYRERATLPRLDNLIEDSRFALRQLRRNPGFAITAVLMLALGIGASVAIFAFVDAALLKPLPYPDPDRLLVVTESVKLLGPADVSYPDYLDWKRDNSVFQSLDVWTGSGALLNTPSGTVPVPGLGVSNSFFRTLGVHPLLGRDFRPGEDIQGAGDVTVLSFIGWHKWFNARPDIIGQKITLMGSPFTVVGVLPENFDFAPRGGPEFFFPLKPVGNCLTNRSCHSLQGVGRLKDGVTLATARSQMESIAAALEQRYPGSNRGQSAFVEPLSEEIVGNFRPILVTLLCGSVLLLTIACVNVANLLLVRSESRRREIAVRGALGASRTRLAAQFLVESAMLVFLGAGLGIGFAYTLVHTLLRLIPKFLMSHMPFFRDLKLSSHTWAFACLVSFAALCIFSLTPLLRLPLGDIRQGLAEGGRSAAGRLWRRLGANLVVLELAVAVVLLVGAGLLGKSFYQLLHVEVNFHPDHLAMIDVMIPPTLYHNSDELVRIQRDLIQRVETLPGVSSAGITSVPPLSFNGNTDWIRFVGRPYHGEHNEVNEREISPEYMKTLQVRLLRGHLFTDTADTTHPKVALINKSLARTYFPGEDPVGQRIGDDGLSSGSIKEIVGVVDDLKEGALDSQMMPAVYYPMYQSPDDGFTLMVRTAQPPATILQELVNTVHSINRGFGTSDPITMEERTSQSPAAYLHRSAAWLIGGFAVVALVLSIVGIYGVISYSVSQRTREIGVRMALGAQRTTVHRLVMREAGRLTIVGLVLGLAASVSLATLIQKLLFATQAWDITTLIAVSAILGSAALLASYLPARRAAAANPVDALRAE
jgi:predicted permease